MKIVEVQDSHVKKILLLNRVEAAELINSLVEQLAETDSNSLSVDLEYDE